MMGERERRGMEEGERRNMQISFELQPLLDIFETTRIDRMNIPRVIGVECDFSYSFKCDDRSMMMNSRWILLFLLFEDGTRTIRGFLWKFVFTEMKLFCILLCMKIIILLNQDNI